MKTAKIYTSKDLNRNFICRIYGNGINKAVGFSGLCAIVNDDELVQRLMDRAMNCMEDVCHCKLRRGIKVSFYYE